MNSIDIIVIVIVLLFGALGIYWGSIRELLALAGLLTGTVFASRYGESVADALSSFVDNTMLAHIFGYIIVLIGVAGLVSLLATLLRNFVGLLFLGWFDHLIGGLLGALQGMLACTIILLILSTFPLPSWIELIRYSTVAVWLVHTFQFLLIFLPDSFTLAAQMTFGLP